MNSLIAISGPTASGKSNLAIKLAKEFKGIVISADSRQIYKELNIGTAKPKPDKIKRDGTWYIDDIPHYLIDFISPKTYYNIYKYQTDVAKIVHKNKDTVIFLVGGTGLYIESILYNYSLPIHDNGSLRDLPLNELQEMAGERINILNESDKNNPRRLVSLINRKGHKVQKSENQSLYLVIDVPKEELETRLSKRIDEMFSQGLLKENQALYTKYKSYDLPSLQTIGYQEFEKYFKDEMTLEDVKELILIHTRQYAKRQRTWFKRNPDIKYIKNYSEAKIHISNFLRTL